MPPTTMTKPELVGVMSESAGITHTVAADALDAFETAVTSTLRAGRAVALPNLGKFSVSDRAARQGHNPSTGERIQIAASKAARFSAGAKLKRALNP